MMKPVQQKGPDSLGQPNKQVGPGTSPIKGGPTNQGPQKSLLGQGPPNQNNQGGPLKPAGQGGPPPNAATGGPNQNKGPAGAQIQNQGSGGPQNQSKGPGGPQNQGSGGPQNQSKGPGGPQNPGSGGPQNQNRGPQQGSGGPQNRGPGGPQNQGSGGPQNQNQGSGGPPNQNRGPGGPQNQNRGPGGPQNQNRGPGGPQNQSMGQGGFQNQNRGQGGPQNQNMGQGGRQMGPGNSEGVSPRGGPGPRGPNQGQGGGQDGPRGPNQNRGGGDRRQGGRGPQDRRGGYGEEGQGMHEGSSGRDGNGPRRGGPGGMYNMKQEQMRHAQFAGPTHTLPSKEGEEVKKFTGRCRLFVGNLSHEIDEEEFKKLFDSYGEVSEVYINKQKGFGFIKMDTRSNAETAKNSLDNTQLKGHTLRVRFASSGTAIKVKNLSNMVSNELLEYAFSMFGEIDRAIVLVDERGRPSGEGIVEFSRKNKAAQTLRRCQEDCFMITNSPRPVVVEPYEEKDQEDGLPERMLPSHSQQFMKERDVGPRLAMPNSFEYEFGQRWKQLYELEKQKKEQLDREIQEDRERLEEQMEFAIYEQETNILREQLRQREEEANALLREKEMRIQQQERLREQHRLRQEEMLRQRQESLGVGGLGGLGGNAAGGMGHGGGGGGDDMRRRQEDNLMMQANQLNTLLEQQEAAMRNIQGGGNNSGNMGGGGNIGGGGNMGGGMDAANGLGGSANTKGVAVDTNRNVGGISGPVGSQQRQSRFDQPNQGGMGGGPNGPPLAGGPMNRGGMGAPGLMGPGGPNAGMNERGGMVRSMEFRDQRDDGYPNDIKRRRF